MWLDDRAEGEVTSRTASAVKRDPCPVRRRSAEGRIDHDASADCADNAADSMDAEHIQAVIIFQPGLQRRAGEQAGRAYHEAKQHGPDRASKTRRRGDGDKARHRA